MVKRITVGSYCKEERETHFWHTEIDGDELIAETSERSWNTKLKKHGWELLEEGRTPEGRWVYSVYKSSQKGLSVRSPDRAKREMTDEQREAARIRLAEARDRRKIERNDEDGSSDEE